MKMNYDLKRKNAAGKWWNFGFIKKNQFNNLQASFKVGALKDLIELAEKEKKEWINLSLFENRGVGAVNAHSQAKGDGFTPEPSFTLDDEVPF